MVAQTRGRNVAVWGASLGAVFTAVMVGVWLWTGAISALTAALFVGAGVFVWLMIAVLFYCRLLERQEQRELQEIAARGGERTSVFTGEAGAQVRPAAARLLFFDKWVVPAFTLIWAGCHAVIGVLVLRYLSGLEGREISSPAEGAVFLVIIGFVAFLFSRYATGMSRQTQWRMLRAAGGYMLVSALFMATVLAALVAAWQGYAKVDKVIAYFVPIVQIVLGAELLVNFVLDLYRPRVPHAEPRASFDSRLFGLLAEPGRIGSSVAEALNYQFGFEVSKTWFYQLVSRALVPLVIFGAAVLFAMSSVVLVRQGHQAVVLHWGKSTGGVLGPGLHLKWPWPIDKARTFDVGAIRRFSLGAGEQRSPEERESHFVNGRELYLWTEEHGERKELDFLVAVPPGEDQPEAGRAEEAPRGVNIIKLLVMLQYVIDDVYKFGFKHVDTHELLEAVAWREMTRYCSSATLDKPVESGGPDRPEAIMTFGRRKAAEGLKRRIQDAVGPAGLDLGVRIVSVNFVGIHPPPDAAPEYEKVLAAERGKDQMRYEAEAEANGMLSEVAGDPQTALQLASAIARLEQLEALATMHRRRDEFVRQMEQYIRLARDEIELLDREIADEDLTATAESQEAAAARRKLRQAAAAHLERLVAISSAKASDAAAAVEAAACEARAESDALFAAASGKPAALLAEASGYRWSKELSERGRADAFKRELLAYNANPEIYMLDRWLDVWDEVLPRLTKYVLGVDRDRIEIWLNVESEVSGIESTLIDAQAGRD